jgi:hypothetical protein
MRQTPLPRALRPPWMGHLPPDHMLPGHFVLLALILAALLGTAPPARADTPVLSLRLVDGATTEYPVTGLQRIGFEGDTLVVAHEGGTERYAAAAVARIVFHWSPGSSGAGDPQDAAALVKVIHLFQNQPNPFSPETRIAFDLAKAGPAELVIYGVDGREVRRLVKGPLVAGRHMATWDGRDDEGNKVGSGVYFYQLTAQGVDESRRMILLP